MATQILNTDIAVVKRQGRSRRLSAAWIAMAIAAVSWGAMMAYYSFAYPCHFFWQEQNQIFLADISWLSTYFDKPGWLGCMVGDYLTQFYYYLYAGPAILALVIALAMIAAWAGVKKISEIGALAVMVVVGIWMFFSSLNAYCGLDAMVCVTGGIASYLLISRLKGWGALLLPLAFWLFGVGAIFLSALIAANALKDNWKRGIAVTAACFAIAFATPAVAKSYYTLPYAHCLVYPKMPVPTAPQRLLEQNRAIDNAYYFGQYDRAIQLAKQVDQVTPVSSFYYYLANAQRGMLPDSLLAYPLRDLGTLTKIGETTPRSVINIMNELYWAVGDMMMTERAAMMHNVFSPRNRNVRMLKRLAEANLVSRDTVAALKYLRILDKTKVYRAWVQDHWPGKMSDRALAEIESKRAMANVQDTLRLGDNCRTILSELLATNPDNVVSLDYLLCTDLLLKQMDVFKADYDRYCMERGKPRTKSLYQQALMIYLAGTNAPAEEWKRYITRDDEMMRFRDYNQQRGSKKYADTYWYYFDTTKP
ncbi:MAG: DUF6057 family protein [Bacteroidales bacterium]|nr:DUF6057 family protein [Bacteroidales bacterium]